MRIEINTHSSDLLDRFNYESMQCRMRRNRYIGLELRVGFSTDKKGTQCRSSAFAVDFTYRLLVAVMDTVAILINQVIVCL